MDIFAYYLTGFIMVPVIIFSMICQAKVNSNFKKYGRIPNSRSLTGAQAAAELLRLNGVTDVGITMIPGKLTDNYNPSTKMISLSSAVYNSNSIAAVGIACHEAGHACQHAQGYVPLKIRNFIIPVTRFGSNLGIPLAIIGMIFSYRPLLLAGIILYSVVAVFQLLTLPVEFNASKRALNTISQNGFLIGEEYNGAKKVLTAAALTYVAALASSLATLLRLLLLSERRR